MKILVLTGGESPEREVSMRSGAAAARALIRRGHSVAVLDTVRPLGADGIKYYSSLKELDCRLFSLTNDISAPVFPLNSDIANAVKTADRVFLALHGGIGENGRLQAMLDCLGVRYCGSGAQGCALAMDKIKTKLLYEQCGILTPRFTVYVDGQKKPPVPPCYPCVVKPADSGSSIGISFVFSPCGLDEAMKKALSVCKSVILEERILGRELSVSVLDDGPLAVTEIIPKSAYYDYASKYKNGGAREITPAPLDKKLYTRAMRIAKNAHSALGLKNFSRTDLILKNGTELLYALETNALPGLTETSILPQAALTEGIDFGELCEIMAQA